MQKKLHKKQTARKKIMSSQLAITILEKPPFYSLYAEGVFSYKTFDKDARKNIFIYDESALIVLYYTYPTYREACLIRNIHGDTLLPSLSKKVRVLFSVRASKVDKLRRAIAFLNKNSRGAFSFDDGFYIRLYFILLQRGKLNYVALAQLAQNTTT
jgi:hypothetical protein